MILPSPGNWCQCCLVTVSRRVGAALGAHRSVGRHELTGPGRRDADSALHLAELPLLSFAIALGLEPWLSFGFTIVAPSVARRSSRREPQRRRSRYRARLAGRGRGRRSRCHVPRVGRGSPSTPARDRQTPSARRLHRGPHRADAVTQRRKLSTHSSGRDRACHAFASLGSVDARRVEGGPSRRAPTFRWGG